MSARTEALEEAARIVDEIATGERYGHLLLKGPKALPGWWAEGALRRAAREIRALASGDPDAVEAALPPTDEQLRKAYHEAYSEAPLHTHPPYADSGKHLAGLRAVRALRAAAPQQEERTP